MFDHFFPDHVGHKKVMPTQLDLVVRATCSCAALLRISLMASLTWSRKPKPAAKDPHYPSACTRCGGPAYIGGNNNIDCKKKCS